MRLSDGLPGRTRPEDAHAFDDAASRTRLFAVLWHTGRGLALIVCFSVLLDQLHPVFAWLVRHGPHPTEVFALIAVIVALDVFVFTKRERRFWPEGVGTVGKRTCGSCASATRCSRTWARTSSSTGCSKTRALAYPSSSPSSPLPPCTASSCSPRGARSAYRHGSPVRRAARWVAVAALVGVPFSMVAPSWWFLALIGSMAAAHGIDEMVRFAVRHPGATHRDLATCLVAASCVAPALLAWRLGRLVINCAGRDTPGWR